MITKELKKLAVWTMEYGLKLGCEAVRVTLYNGSDTEFEIRNNQLDRLQQSTENQLSVQVYVDGRFGSFSTNRLKKGELEPFLSRAVEAVRYLSVDPDRKLPDAAVCFSGDASSLDLYDSAYASITPDQKLAVAKAAAQEIVGTDQRILSVQTNWNDGNSFHYIVSSNGFEGEKAVSYYSLSASVSVKGAGDARPESFWYDQALTYDELIKEGVAKKALERAINKIGQQKIESGRYKLLVDNMNSVRLLNPILQAINGAAIHQKNTFLLDKLGQKIFSDRFTLTDDPHVPHTFGARFFDNEGVATAKRRVFDGGVLNLYFMDTYHASKLKMPQTISGPSRLVLEPGTRTCTDLITGVDKGILVTGFNGGNSNSNSGDFSFGIEGFLIKNGQLVCPVSEMNMTGNMLTLWNNLLETGNDPRENNAFLIPSLLFDQVDFSGM